MSEPTATTAQAAPDAQPQAGTEPAAKPEPQAGTAQPQAGGEPEYQPPSKEDWEGLQRELKEARTEAAKRRKDQAESAKQAQAALDAQKPEAERNAQKLAELEAEKANWTRERQELYVEQSVARLAAKHALVDTRAAVRLMDWSRLDFDDEGRPKNTETVLADLLKECPYLAGNRPPAPPRVDVREGTGTGPTPQLTAAELAAAQSAGMTAERYAALKNVLTISDWQAANPPIPPAPKQ